MAGTAENGKNRYIVKTHMQIARFEISKTDFNIF